MWYLIKNIIAVQGPQTCLREVRIMNSKIVRSWMFILSALAFIVVFSPELGRWITI